MADDLAEARGHARGEIAGAHGGAGRHDDDVVLRDRLAEHAFELGRLVGNDAAQHRLAARLADEQHAGHDVIRFQVLFPITVEAPGGDVGEIERGGAQPALTADAPEKR